MKIKTFAKGDKVTITEHGAIGWEDEDWSLHAISKLPKKMKIFTIEEYRGGGEYASVQLSEDSSKYDVHPNHFTKIETPQS